LDREVRESISEVKEKVHQKTSVSSTKFGQKMRIKVKILDYTMEDILSIEYEDGR